MFTPVERQHLNGDVPLRGGLEHPGQLGAQYRASTNRTFQYCLVQHDPQSRSVVGNEPFLAPRTGREPFLKLRLAGECDSDTQDCPCVVLRL